MYMYMYLNVHVHVHSLTAYDGIGFNTSSVSSGLSLGVSLGVVSVLSGLLLTMVLDPDDLFRPGELTTFLTPPPVTP